MPRLVFKSDGMPAQPIDLKLGMNRIGRAPGNDFQIDHPTVSSRHCEIVYLNDSVLVRDGGSTNGTFIDGRPVQEAVLQPGQILLLGEVELTIEEVIAPVAIPHLDAPGADRPVFLPDGAAACLNHPQSRATERCRQCERAYCEICVHELHLVGRKSLKCCPACSGKCDPIPQPRRPKKKSLLGFLAKTLKIRSKPRR